MQGARPLQNRNNLLNRIFITRERMTLCLTNAKLKEKLVSPLLTYYNKNKHSWLYHLLGIGLRLYCTKEKAFSKARAKKVRMNHEQCRKQTKNAPRTSIPFEKYRCPAYCYDIRYNRTSESKRHRSTCKMKE